MAGNRNPKNGNNRVSKKAVKSTRAEEAFKRRSQKVNLARRMCRQMLEQVLGAGNKLGLPPFAGLTKERISEMRQAFAKGPIDSNRSKRIADSRRREAAMADLRRALDYINEYGIGQKQNDDGSYEPREEEDAKEAIEEEESDDEEEDEGDEEEVEEEEDEEEEADGGETGEGCQEGLSDIEMADAANGDEQVAMISKGVRRLKLVAHPRH